MAKTNFPPNYRWALIENEWIVTKFYSSKGKNNDEIYFLLPGKTETYTRHNFDNFKWGKAIFITDNDYKETLGYGK